MYEKSYGNKYEENKDLDIKEVAKLIRKDLREEFPNSKFSVRIKRYSGGQSITVRIKNVPSDFIIHNPEWVQQRCAGDETWGVSQFSEEAESLLDSVKGVVNAYNFDGSDVQSDYFNVRFYSHIKFERDLMKQREETE